MVFIVLGVFNPSLDLFERQLKSLRAQTHQRLEVLLVCDGSLAAEAQSLVSSLQDQPFVLVLNDDKAGVHANFGRGLNVALAKSRNQDDLFAFCDQDDVWHPEKLALQVEALTTQRECGLCHCDARVVDERGQTVADSLFRYEERSTKMGLLDLLVMNSVTGMTLVATKFIAASAQDFPMQGTREVLHDHWLALVAAAQSRVIFLNTALVDYVQHDANQVGARRALPPRSPLHNLAFGGRAYWQRCKRQYAWRRRALEALETSIGPSQSLRTADLRGWLGTARLFSHMVSSRLRGDGRHAAQCWRLLAGKLLSGLG